MGLGSIAGRGCIKSGVDHGKFGVGRGSWVSQVRCRSWVVGLSSSAWVMMGSGAEPHSGLGGCGPCKKKKFPIRL